jgi:hypothetical protein
MLSHQSADDLSFKKNTDIAVRSYRFAYTAVADFAT